MLGKTMLLWNIVIVILLVFPSSSQPPKNLTIYGVRWFLGEHFTYTIDIDSNDNNEYFVLAFNSDYKLDGELSVKIGKNRFTCTSEYMSTEQLTVHHPGEQNFTNNIGDDIVDRTHLHKCVIGDIRTITNKTGVKIINYAITLDVLYKTQLAQISINKVTNISLYNGTFRLPYYEQSFQALVIGDWGEVRQAGKKKGYVDPLPCILKKVEENPNLVMIIFTGDIAYDLQGSKYYSILKYMQPLTSKITLVATPGNHDTMHHADTFELFTKTYYTPQWWTYSNYFNKFTIGKLLFIYYNPEQEQYDFMHADRLKKKVSTIFEAELTPQVIDSIKNKYFPIVVSHYPIHCSDPSDSADSCNKNPQRMKTYLQYFKKLDMKLYLSGHLHVYERTFPICFDGTVFQSKTSQYNMSCPLFVVEGAGGNDQYVQMNQQYQHKNFSSSIVFNTGFGILTINSASENSYPDTVNYQHISASNCSVADHFKMINADLSQSSSGPNVLEGKYSYVWKLMIKAAVLCFIASILIILFLLVKKRYWKSSTLIKSEKNIQQLKHVQMVQQNFDGPTSGKNENETK